MSQEINFLAVNVTAGSSKINKRRSQQLSAIAFYLYKPIHTKFFVQTPYRARISLMPKKLSKKS
jgi:hypothetical protein